MGILTRCVNLFKADINGVMDQLEDKGLLLKQYLRDMEEALARKQNTLNKTILTKDRMKKEKAVVGQEIEKLDQDITEALKRDKEDIARLLIRKSRSRTSHRDALLRHIESLEKDIAELRACVEKQQLQYDQMKLKTEVYFRDKAFGEMEKSMSAASSYNTFGEPSDEEVELELICRQEALKGGDSR